MELGFFRKSASVKDIIPGPVVTTTGDMQGTGIGVSYFQLDVVVQLKKVLLNEAGVVSGLFSFP
jgi:hypothetical protein